MARIYSSACINMHPRDSKTLTIEFRGIETSGHVNACCVRGFSVFVCYWSSMVTQYAAFCLAKSSLSACEKQPLGLQKAANQALKHGVLNAFSQEFFFCLMLNRWKTGCYEVIRKSVFSRPRAATVAADGLLGASNCRTKAYPPVVKTHKYALKGGDRMRLYNVRM